MNFAIPKKQRGQSLVESALVIPLIFLLIFTFIDLGRGIYYYTALRNSVREGARFASVTKIFDETEENLIIAQVKDYSIALEPGLLTVYLSHTGDDSEYIQVRATYEFTPVTPFLARLFGPGNSITLDTQSTMLLAPIAR